jgi:hypothetical protein
VLSLTSVLALVVLLSMAVGLFAKNRTVRTAAWCVGGIVVLSVVLFVVFVVPRLLQR